jgi:LmbE family N-acetylglucosaminyl deacetylase
MEMTPPAPWPLPDLLPLPLDPLTLGSVLVVAPHPDDESLGCGGTVARLRQADVPVHVLMVSDGTMSHPHSPTYPAARLRAVREAETIEALRRLGVSAEDVTFLRQPDARVATPEQPEFDNVVALIVDVLARVRPGAVLLPWRRDPHRDHRAVWQLTDAALTQLPDRPRRLEYMVWLWERADPADWPRPGEVRAWQVDIGSVLAVKKEAIAAHQSQVTRLIDDDPTGFYLSPALLRHFDRSDEFYFEA